MFWTEIILIQFFLFSIHYNSFNDVILLFIVGFFSANIQIRVCMRWLWKRWQKKRQRKFSAPLLALHRHVFWMTLGTVFIEFIIFLIILLMIITCLKEMCHKILFNWSCRAVNECMANLFLLCFFHILLA